MVLKKVTLHTFTCLDPNVDFAVKNTSLAMHIFLLIDIHEDNHEHYTSDVIQVKVLFQRKERCFAATLQYLHEKCTWKENNSLTKTLIWREL